jgi:peroxiredoxin
MECFPFIVLPDPDHSVMDLYGQEVKLQKLGRMPAQMLIDKTGILKFVYYGSSMADIPNLTQIEKIFSKSLQ